MSDISLILKYFPDLSEEKQNLFAKLPELYSDWNKKINLVSRQDIQSLLERHILHSLAIAKFMQFEPNQTVIDIGTGGGFPGIPLAIMFPETKFILVDSVGKKIKVVQDIASQLGLTNIEAVQARIESIELRPDFYVTRAVASLSDLKPWIRSKTPLIALKGGDLTSELKGFPKAELLPLTSYFDEEFFETKSLVKVSFS